MQFLQSSLLARQIKCCREYLLVFSKYFMQYWQQAACKNLTESGYSLLFLVSYKKVSKEADIGEGDGTSRTVIATLPYVPHPATKSLQRR